MQSLRIRYLIPLGSLRRQRPLFRSLLWVLALGLPAWHLEPLLAQQPGDCRLVTGEHEIRLENASCRIVWSPSQGVWQADYQCRVGNAWQTVARDSLAAQASYAVVFPGEPQQDFRYTRGPGNVQQALPPATRQPTVLEQTAQVIRLQWSFEIVDHQQRKWPVTSEFRLRRGDAHIHERVQFRAPEAAQVRYQRGWSAQPTDVSFFETLVNSVTHSGWAQGPASFLAVIDPGTAGWDGSRGGGGFVRVSSGFDRRSDGSFVPRGSDTSYTALHRVPHVVQQQGWVDTRFFDTYTLEHDLMFWPGPWMERPAIAALHALRPPRPLPPRSSWQDFMDRQVEGLRHAPEPLFVDGGDWGHYRLGWFNGFNDPRCTPPHTFFQFGRQSLDWGGNWDLWIAIALRRYGLQFDDPWAVERANKLVQGIKTQLWQIDDPGTPADGAFWMFRPLTQQEYLRRKASRPSGEKGGTIEKGTDLWICDSGKIGYWLCELSQELDDPQLLDKAERAAAFLLRQQRSDGNLRSGRLHISGQAVYPANLATNSSAIMLWARLYEITNNRRYRDAADRCADYTIKHWLNGKDWKLYGCEWDVPGNNSTWTASYAAWGFAILHRATGHEGALDAVRWSADYMVLQQTLFDTHFGFYMPKAYWRGRDARTTGGMAQGMHPEGYGQLLGTRPEPPYSLWLAWKATGDRLYRDAAYAYLVWMSYMQHDCPYDYRFHGGASEGLEWTLDTLNGFGTVYIGETFGTTITLLELLAEENHETTPATR